MTVKGFLVLLAKVLLLTTVMSLKDAALAVAIVFLIRGIAFGIFMFMFLRNIDKDVMRRRIRFFLFVGEFLILIPISLLSVPISWQLLCLIFVSAFYESTSAEIK